MPEFDSHAARLFHRHAAARLFGNASLPDQAQVHVHLPVRGNLHGGFHEEDLQFHQWPGDPASYRFVSIYLWRIE